MSEEFDIDDIAAEIAASMGGDDPVTPEQEKPAAESGDVEEVSADEGEAAEGEAEDERAEASEGDGDRDEGGEDSEVEGPQPLEQWTDERKEAFLALPNEARELVLEQAKETDRVLDRKVHELQKERRTYDGVMRALDPVMDRLKEAGQRPEDAAATFIQAQMEIQKDPVAGIAGIVKRHLGFVPETERDGFLRQIAERVGLSVEAPDGGDDDYLDPRAKDEIAGLKAELADFKRSFQQMASATQEQAASSQMAEVKAVHDEFRSAKLEDGSLKYPHLDQVGQRMAKMFQSGYAEGSGLKEIVENAYHAAVAMDPALRAKAAANVTDISQAVKRSASPKRRAVSEGPRYVSKGDIEEDVENAMRANGF